MEAQERAEVRASEGANRRAYPRYFVDGAAVLLFMDRGATMPCNLLDLSLGGCRLRTREPFFPGLGGCVEVTFTVRGIALRFRGVTQWSDGQSMIGIRFVDLTSRRKEELSEVLSEVAAEEAEKQLAEAETGTEPAREESAPRAEEPAAASVQALTGTFHMPKGRERRRQVRQEVDDAASIFLINGGAVLHGRIVNLSLGGCRIWTKSRFLVGIYTRVEAEFRIAGQAFRLAGVIQAIHDRQQVGIRFLDMSDRKRKQVEQLMQELQEKYEGGSSQSREMLAR
ncbi:MAG: PilZ domain-containing protein [Terracidiphilus sp.]|nr:PilZ domain-containing protein [Terracidiphilus sp.]